MTREPAKNPAASIRARLLALAQSPNGTISNQLQQNQANLDCEGQHSIVGYKFGYRHQFGSITDNYAKLLMGSHLWISDITLNFAYLS